MNNAPPLPPCFDLPVLVQAHATACTGQQSLFDALESLTGLPPHAALAGISAHTGWSVIDIAAMYQLFPAFDLLPLVQAITRGAILLRDSANMLIAVVSTPFDANLQVWLDTCAQAPLQYRLALPADIQVYLEKQEAQARAVDNVAASGEGEPHDNNRGQELSLMAVSELTSPAVKLVNSTLYDALKAGASDVHFESTPTGLAVRYRIDGVLAPVALFPGEELAQQVISRIKVLAELDISERRVPQDGSFRVRARLRDIDLRVSVMPSIHGEDGVVRILDKRAMMESHGSLTLDALGFDADSLDTLRRLVQAPHGMLLVTGPTGSGKTTTLYAAISEMNRDDEKIITIEDPVECQLPGVLQIPVNEKKGLSFARGLRSILRHDPDKIMVGEIRDEATAEIAVQAALTGHLVLSTVHANTVFDVFGRFTHMKLDPYAFVSALNGIWAQRLLRLTCSRCARPATPSSEQLMQIASLAHSGTTPELRVGLGCGDCRGTGYRGRTAIAEILTLTDDIREMIIDRAPLRAIKKAARANGTRPLSETAAALAVKGLTTLEEVQRVTLAD